MTASTDNFNSPKLAGEDLVQTLAVYDAEVLYAGTMVAVDYTDELQAAANTQGLRVVGSVDKKVDNTDDGEVAEVKRGIYRYENSSTYAIPRSAIGEICYVEDDQTVAGYATNLVPAGLVHDIDDDGVWVDQRPAALALAWRNRPQIRVAKTDDYTVTAAIAFDGRTFFACDKTASMEITLPTAVAGMRVGVQRGNATAAHDVTIQAATGDKIQASDGFCAAGKQSDNTVDAISDILWLRAQSDTEWIIDNPTPKDMSSWVKNDA